MISAVLPADGHFICTIWCCPGWVWVALRFQRLLPKAHSESTVWSKTCWERCCFLDDKYRYSTSKVRLSKDTPVKKAMVLKKAGGFRGRWTRGISAGIWLVRLSM